MAEFDVDVLYVSLDSPEKNAEFAASMGASLPVVSDAKGEVAKRFGVIGLGGLYSKRWTFYADAEGILRAIDKDVRPATAGADIIRKLEQLGFPRRMSSAPPADHPPTQDELDLLHYELRIERPVRIKVPEFQREERLRHVIFSGQFSASMLEDLGATADKIRVLSKMREGRSEEHTSELHSH